MDLRENGLSFQGAGLQAVSGKRTSGDIPAHATDPARHQAAQSDGVRDIGAMRRKKR